MSYNRDTIIEKNLTLSFEFERYALEHPEMLSAIPEGAEVGLLPRDDPELYSINLEAAEAARRKHHDAKIVFVEVEAVAPPRSRLVNPRLRGHPARP